MEKHPLKQVVADKSGQPESSSTPQTGDRDLNTLQLIDAARSDERFSPLRYLPMTIGGIFLAEVVALGVVYQFKDLPDHFQTLMDAGIAIVLILPILYFFSIKPLLQHIERRRQAEAQIREMALFTALNPEAAFQVRVDGWIERNNPAAAQLGLQVGKLLFEIIPDLHDLDIPKCIALRAAPQTREARLNDRLLQWTIRGAPELGCAFFYSQDITAHKRDQDDLQKARAKLELRLQKPTQELMLGNQKLQEEINERLQVETQLTAVMLRLEAHIDNSPLAVIEFDPQFHVIRWSKEAERMFGWSAAEVVGRAIAELNWVYEEDGELVSQVSSDMLNGKRPHNVSVNRNYRKDGAIIHCEWYNSALYNAKGQLTSILSLVLDISPRKLAEEALRASEARFRLALKNVPVSVAAQDLDLRFLWAYNQRTVDARAVIGKTDFDVFPPEDAAHLVALKRQVIETSKELRQQIWITSGGQRVFLDLFIEPQCDERGKVTGIGIAAVDLTPMKLAEEALRQSEERYKKLVKYGPAVIYEMDLQGTQLLSVNDVMCQLSGYSREELLAMSPFDFLDEESKKRFQERIKKIIAGEQPDENVEYGVIIKDGRKLWITLNVKLTTRDEKNVGALVIGHDITERKRAEEELRSVNEELIRFNTAMVGRELRMIELKDEVNDLCAQSAKPLRYPLDFVKEEK